MYAPGDELRDLLDRVVSRARELGTHGIYRGEPECFPRISSGLYRELHEIDDESFHIGAAQQRRIELARRYAPHLSNDDVLTRLQHLGGKTNLIDFTRDLNVALFFSSYHSPDEDGRVILMQEPLVLREEDNVSAPYKLMAHGTPANMTGAQKSVWVEPEKGYIDEEHVTIIEIPGALKPEILAHLQVVYGVEASTVYNDLSGFIRDQDRFRDYEAEWHAGVRAYENSQYESAIESFTHYEQLVEAPTPDMHYYRGISYWYANRRQEALADIATLRRGSSHGPTAFPEEMESAYAEHIDRDADAPATEVCAGFRIRLDGDPVALLGTSLYFDHESGQEYEQELDRKETFVSFAGIPPRVGETWDLSVENLQGYHAVVWHPMRWPVRETVVLEAVDNTFPDLKLEIESLQYTYKAGIDGPIVAYPASGDIDDEREA